MICGANQWTGFYMITASVMEGLSASVTKLYVKIEKARPFTSNFKTLEAVILSFSIDRYDDKNDHGIIKGTTMQI